ncbi:putative ankyrin repeat-containing protein, partial [Trichoderma atroviride IMI 206040]
MGPKAVGKKLDVYAVVELLLLHGIDPRMSEHHGITPLHVACVRGRFDLAELLLRFNAPINLTDGWGFTPLERAYGTGDIRIIEMLIGHGADVEAWMLGGEPPLARCIYDGKLDIFEAFLPFADINQATMLGFAPIHLASDGADRIDQGDAETVSILLEYGADLSKYLQSGETVSPFHNAARYGHVKICDILLQHEPAFLNLQIEKGFMIESPLFMACHRKKKEVVRFLLDKGAKADQLSFYYKESPLFTACDVGDLEIAKMVLEAAPQMINVPTAFNCTPLVYACEHGNVEMVKMLLDAGAGIYLPNGARTT